MKEKIQDFFRNKYKDPVFWIESNSTCLSNLGSIFDLLLLSAITSLIFLPVKTSFFLKEICLKTYDLLHHCGAHRKTKKFFLQGFKWVKRKLCRKKDIAKQNSYTSASLATPESDQLRIRSPASSCSEEEMSINFHTSDFFGGLESTLESDTVNTVNIIINNGLIQPGCYDDTEDISQRRL